jgi:hypothetical protein
VVMLGKTARRTKGVAMNYDVVKFCWGCQKPKPREQFAPIKPGSKRMACESCRDRSNKGNAEKPTL